MPTLDEAVTAQGGAASLLESLRVLSLNQDIPFTQYVRKVLPLDGYVFWLKTKTMTVAGSIHITAQHQQLEDEQITINRVIFSTSTKVEHFTDINPQTIWVGEYAGERFGFVSRGPFYKSENLYHYVGDALNPAISTQLVDTGAQLPDDTLIVSNSLPAWLALATYSPVWLEPPNPQVELFPSFLVPQDLAPPYGSVHVIPGETQFLQAIPNFGHKTYSQWQLCRDLVRVTLYGLTNAEALAFLDLVYSYSRDTNVIGIMNPAVVRDEKRTQPELGVLAMKKTMEFEVSYNQGTTSDIARQLIREACATIIPRPFGAP